MTIVEKWAIAGTVATIIYTFLTYRLLMQNKKINETNNKLAEFQIYNEIAKRLNAEQTRNLIEKIKNNKLINSDNDNNEFRLYLLDPLEDLAVFHNMGLITIENIDSGFGDLILLVGKSNVINIYLKNLRDASKVYYSGFDSLYNEIMKKYPTNKFEKNKTS